MSFSNYTLFIMSMWIKIVSSSLLIWLSKLLFCTVWKRSLNIGKIIVKPLEISNANQHIEGAASHTVQQYTMKAMPEANGLDR